MFVAFNTFTALVAASYYVISKKGQKDPLAIIITIHIWLEESNMFETCDFYVFWIYLFIYHICW